MGNDPRIASHGDEPMTQALNTEPEDLPENFLMRKEACCSPSPELSEHAELVQAIMRNFPEIYFKSDRNQSAQLPNEPAIQGQVIHPSAAA
jgi:hypothetical protein